MSTLLTRMYEAYGDALDAVHELKKNRFTDANVHLISLAPNAPHEGPDLHTRIMAAGVPAADASALASLIEQGQTLIVVKAVMGVALKANSILDAYHPIAQSKVAKEYYQSLLDRAAPLSSAFGLPTLYRDPTPFATFWNMPSIAGSATPSLWHQPSRETTFFGFPKLLRTKQTFSSWYNLPMLTKSQRPFSEFFRMPELTSISAPFSAFFRVPSLINEKGWDAQVQGVPKLTDSSASLSRFFGWPILTQQSGPMMPSQSVHNLSTKAAPFSGALQLPTLLRGRWSLSGMFGLPLLLNRREPKH